MNESIKSEWTKMKELREISFEEYYKKLTKKREEDRAELNLNQRLNENNKDYQAGFLNGYCLACLNHGVDGPTKEKWIERQKLCDRIEKIYNNELLKDQKAG